MSISNVGRLAATDTPGVRKIIKSIKKKTAESQKGKLGADVPQACTRLQSILSEGHIAKGVNLDDVEWSEDLLRNAKFIEAIASSTTCAS